MNTEQNYVGGGNYATPTEPTATLNPPTGQNQAQHSFLSDEGKLSTTLQENYKDAVGDLLSASTNLADDEGVAEAVRALTTVLNHYIRTEYKKFTRQHDDEDLNYYEKVVTGVLDVIEFVTNISEKGEQAQHYKRLTKEVGRA